MKIVESFVERPVDDGGEGELPDVIAMLGAAAGGDAKVIVYRHTDGGKIAYCDTVQLAAFTSRGLEYIQSRFGGGSYRLQLHGKKGDATRASIIRSFDVQVVALPSPTPPTPTPTQTPTMNINTIMAVAPVAIEVLRAAKELLAPPPYPYNNPIQPVSSGAEKMMEMIMMLNGMNQLKGAMNDTFGIQPDGSGNGRGAMLEALGSLVKVMQPQQIQATPAPAQTPVQTPAPAPVHELNDSLQDAADGIAAIMRNGGDVDDVVIYLDGYTDNVYAQIKGMQSWMVDAYAMRYELDKAKLCMVLEHLNAD